MNIIQSFFWSSWNPTKKKEQRIVNNRGELKFLPFNLFFWQIGKTKSSISMQNLRKINKQYKKRNATNTREETKDISCIKVLPQKLCEGRLWSHQIQIDLEQFAWLCLNQGKTWAIIKWVMSKKLRKMWELLYCWWSKIMGNRTSNLITEKYWHAITVKYHYK